MPFQPFTGTNKQETNVKQSTKVFNNSDLTVNSELVNKVSQAYVMSMQLHNEFNSNTSVQTTIENVINSENVNNVKISGMRISGKNTKVKVDVKNLAKAQLELDFKNQAVLNTKMDAATQLLTMDIIESQQKAANESENSMAAKQLAEQAAAIEQITKNENKASADGGLSPTLGVVASGLANAAANITSANTDQKINMEFDSLVSNTSSQTINNMVKNIQEYSKDLAYNLSNNANVNADIKTAMKNKINSINKNNVVIEDTIVDEGAELEVYAENKVDNTISAVVEQMTDMKNEIKFDNSITQEQRIKNQQDEYNSAKNGLTIDQTSTQAAEAKQLASQSNSATSTGIIVYIIIAVIAVAGIGLLKFMLVPSNDRADVAKTEAKEKTKQRQAMAEAASSMTASLASAKSKGLPMGGTLTGGSLTKLSVYLS